MKTVLLNLRFDSLSVYIRLFSVSSMLEKKNLFLVGDTFFSTGLPLLPSMVENVIPQESLKGLTLHGFLIDTTRLAGRNAEQVWK